MTKTVFRFAMLMICLSSGCVQTRYAPRSITGGYSEVRVADDMYFLTFSGNAYLDVAKVREYFLYRAAELTVGAGRSFFVVYEDEKQAKPIQVSALLPSDEGFRMMTFKGTKHTNRGYVKMFGSKPDDVVIAYHAPLILSQMRDKYPRARRSE